MMAKRLLLAAVAAFGLAGVVVTAFGQNPPASPPAPMSDRVTLHGAGATFPAPLYHKWIDIYTKANPQLAVEYLSIGSGEGVKLFLSEAIDFGASDSALTDEQIATAKSGAILAPVTAGAIVLAYNLPDLGGTLKLSREVYADIFLGKIREWNDPRIQALNPGLKLTKQTIMLIARQESSGTTFAFTNHLSAISEVWRKGPGVGKTVNWPGVSSTARGNEGVAGRIKQSWGALGYIEYGFAKRLGLPMAQLQNRAGEYVAPGPDSGQAALEANVNQIPDNLRVFLPDPAGKDSYPIVTFTWLLLHGQYADPRKSAALKGFVDWALTDGQSFSGGEGYIPLPADVATLARTAVDRIR